MVLPRDSRVTPRRNSARQPGLSRAMSSGSRAPPRGSRALGSRAMSKGSPGLLNLDQGARRSRVRRQVLNRATRRASRGNPSGALRRRGSQPAPGRTIPRRSPASRGRDGRVRNRATRSPAGGRRPARPPALNPYTRSLASLGRHNPTSPHPRRPAVGRRPISNPSRRPRHCAMLESAMPNHARPPARAPHHARQAPRRLARRSPGCSGPQASPCPTSLLGNLG